MPPMIKAYFFTLFFLLVGLAPSASYSSPFYDGAYSLLAKGGRGGVAGGARIGSRSASHSSKSSHSTSESDAHRNSQQMAAMSGVRSKNDNESNDDDDDDELVK